MNTITRHMVAEEHQNKFTKGKSKLFKHNLANKSKDVILPPFFFFVIFRVIYGVLCPCIGSPV